MDIRNARAVKTLIRNKLNSDKDWGETHLWFHEKGITVDLQGDYYFLNADRRGHISELSDFCNSIIYKNNELMCFHGMPLPKSTLEDTKNNTKFIWNEKTIFIENLIGKETYMFWDKFENKWIFSDDKRVNSPYRKLVEENLYNIMSLDPSFTYCFKIVESGNNPGIFLETMYSNDTCKEVDWQEVYRISLKIQMKHPDIYAFQGFDQLEESDFPIIVRDVSTTTILLEKIK